MRHNVVNNKFRMKTSHRIATFRNMTVSLIENGKIETTLDKAKVLRGVVEPLITLAKRGEGLNSFINKNVRDLYSDKSK